MCGVAVAIDWPDPERTVAALAQGVRHRGDVTDPVVRPWPGAAVCTRRLRIVDPEQGAQPMLSRDGRLMVSFNGEIYNHRELRRELEAQGVVFRTQSDTEVLAEALCAWGAGALPRLVGMYAFVALDLRSRQFLAARDPLGVKPLYLVQQNGGYLFCSEIAPLLAATETADVLLMPPGHLLTRSVCAPFPSPFTQAPTPGRPSAQELDAALSGAVERRLPQDLPFALMFSGGIDSTLVAHYARRTRPEAPAYFLGDATSPDYRFAAEYADRADLDLRLEPLPDDDADLEPLVDALVETVESFEPATVRGGICNYLLSRRMGADGFRVVLCGDGADELFAGYRPHELGYAAGDAIGEVIRNQCLALMARDNLQLLDRCSMRFQIEAREPFLDPAVIGLALGQDAGSLLSRHGDEMWGKAPLRALFDLHPKALPTSIRDRRKTPFNQGCGLDHDPRSSPLTRHADATISDAELAEGRRAFARYAISSKEELLYLRKLAARFDIDRVPHLANRLTLTVPRFAGDDGLIASSISHSDDERMAA